MTQPATVYSMAPKIRSMILKNLRQGVILLRTVYRTNTEPIEQSSTPLPHLNPAR